MSQAEGQPNYLCVLTVAIFGVIPGKSAQDIMGIFGVS